MQQTTKPLTFRNGQFVLDPNLELTKKLFGSPLKDHWTKINPDEYSTTNLKAALAFRRYGDDIAEKVFDRALVKYFDLPSLKLPEFLDPHQKEGVKWILSRSRSYIAHAPGAGKTATSIVASQLIPGTGTVVIIVPPGLTTNWQRELEKFLSLLEVWPSVSTIGRSENRHLVNWKADYILVPDSMLAKKWVKDGLRKIKIRFLAVDEASRFKSPSAERSLVLYNGLIQRAARTVFLDGSPMPNRPIELWAPAYALNPECIDYMELQDFGFRYGGATRNERGQWEFNGSSRESELKEKIQKNFMHVVTETELSHPERRRSMLFMNDVRSQEHKTWEQKHLSGITIDSDEDSQGELARFRQELGMRKTNWIYQYVSERLKEKNESILLFVWHREVAERLNTMLQNFKPVLVIGGVSNEEREKGFEAFQAGRRRLIIGNIGAMGRGHNLQRADRVIFGEYSWTDELNKQAEKRASRRGNEKAFVRCEYIVSPGSVDEKVLRSIFSKEKRVKRVIG